MSRMLLYLILLVVVFSLNALPSKKTIVDFYLDAPPQLVKIGKFKLKTHTLDTGQVLWYVTDPSRLSSSNHRREWPRWEDRVITVDLTNGFIEVNLGVQSLCRQQIALFTSSSGNEYIGFCYGIGTPFGHMNSYLSFHHVKNGTWVDTTKKLITHDVRQKFLKKKFTAAQFDLIGKIIKPYSVFSVSLPRYGTDLTYKLEKYIVESILKYNKVICWPPKSNNLSDNEIRILRAFLDNIKTTEITLKWSIKLEKFML